MKGRAPIRQAGRASRASRSGSSAKRQPPVQGFSRNGAALVPLLAIGAIAAQVFPGEAGRTQVHHVQIGSRRLPGGVLHVVSCASTGGASAADKATACRSEEHTSELQSLMRISYAVFCLKKKITNNRITTKDDII